MRVTFFKVRLETTQCRLIESSQVYIDDIEHLLRSTKPGFLKVVCSRHKLFKKEECFPNSTIFQYMNDLLVALWSIIVGTFPHFLT